MSSAIILQTSLRAMTARNEFMFRKQTKAAVIIQVLAVFSLGSFHDRGIVHLIVQIKLHNYILVFK